MPKMAKKKRYLSKAPASVCATRVFARMNFPYCYGEAGMFTDPPTTTWQ